MLMCLLYDLMFSADVLVKIRSTCHLGPVRRILYTVFVEMWCNTLLSIEFVYMLIVYVDSLLHFSNTFFGLSRDH